MENAKVALDAFMTAFGTVAACVGLGQAAVFHGHELCWNEIDYYLQVRQVHIETLNNLREEIRDMHEIDSRKMDNSMLVATLMLTIGFGFVVEGTFPVEAPDKDSPKMAAYQQLAPVRVAYAVAAGLSLVCPFWSVLCLTECRRRLCYFMELFNVRFQGLMQERYDKFTTETQSSGTMHDSHLVRYTQGLPKDIYNSRLSAFYTVPARISPCPRRRRHEEGASDRVFAPGDFEAILRIRREYARWWQEWCERPLGFATKLFHLGIVANVLTTILLLGMNFCWNYPETPWMWKAYVLVVSSGLVVALIASSVASCPSWTRRANPDALMQPLLETGLEAGGRGGGGGRGRLISPRLSRLN